MKIPSITAEQAAAYRDTIADHVGQLTVAQADLVIVCDKSATPALFHIVKDRYGVWPLTFGEHGLLARLLRASATHRIVWYPA